MCFPVCDYTLNTNVFKSELLKQDNQLPLKINQKNAGHVDEFIITGAGGPRQKACVSEANLGSIVRSFLRREKKRINLQIVKVEEEETAVD